MIRGNLATRPFYDEGAVHRWLALATAILLAVSAYNVWQYVGHARSDRELRLQVNADEARASELRAAAAALRRGQDEPQTRRTSAAALEANELIARRTFSWTQLFNRFESALPPDVRITAVRPAARGGEQRALVITVAARSVNAIDTFMQSLEESGAFTDPLARDEQVAESGEIEGVIEVLYTPAEEAR